MSTFLLLLVLCDPQTHQCQEYRMDTFVEDDSHSRCEEVIKASGQKGAYPLRCEVE